MFVVYKYIIIYIYLLGVVFFILIFFDELKRMEKSFDFSDRFRFFIADSKKGILRFFFRFSLGGRRFRSNSGRYDFFM